MPDIKDLFLNLSFDWYYYILFAVLVVGTAIFSYRYTLPPIEKYVKSILLTLRILVLLIILFLIFEPILNITYVEKQLPVNLYYIDNSSSMKMDEVYSKNKQADQFLQRISSDNKSVNKFYTFGQTISEFYPDSLDTLSYTEGVSNFANIFQHVKTIDDNVSAITILSDGILTDGAKPIYAAEKSGVPVFSIALGDSTPKKDVALSNLLHNEYIFANSSTAIMAVINNRGYAGEKVSVKLYEERKLIDEKNITLSSNGIQNVLLDYKPTSPGEKKIYVYVSPLQDEITEDNNGKLIYLNVLDNKMNITIFAGAPHQDITFLRNAIEQDSNVVLNTSVKINENKTIGKQLSRALLDSTDILFLVNFPSPLTNAEELALITNTIQNKATPFFYLLGNNISANVLQQFDDYLPFILKSTTSGILQVQPFVDHREERNPIIQTGASDAILQWNDLPPVYQKNWDFIPKPDSRVVATVMVNNVHLKIPLLLTNSLGSKRTIALLASNIWRWKLRNTDDNNLFDNFIRQAIKWLYAGSEKKQVSIRTTKKVYAQNEDVKFIAEVYDESYNAVNDAEVTVNVRHQQQTAEVMLNPVGNGFYEGLFQPADTGDYTFDGSGIMGDASLGKDYGRFNVGAISIEQLNPITDAYFLYQLADRTKGKFYYNEFNQYFDDVAQINNNAEKEISRTSEFLLWSDQYIMIFVILLFALEWFIRKRQGML